jgi:hypothetical protein
MGVLGKITPGKNYTQVMRKLFSGLSAPDSAQNRGDLPYAKRIEVVPLS